MSEAASPTTFYRRCSSTQIDPLIRLHRLEGFLGGRKAKILHTTLMHARQGQFRLGLANPSQKPLPRQEIPPALQGCSASKGDGDGTQDVHVHSPKHEGALQNVPNCKVRLSGGRTRWILPCIGPAPRPLCGTFSGGILSQSDRPGSLIATVAKATTSLICVKLSLP